jgi:hypothetical protein
MRLGRFEMINGVATLARHDRSIDHEMDVIYNCAVGRNLMSQAM